MDNQGEQMGHAHQSDKRHNHKDGCGLNIAVLGI